jgi:hypothetical protein
VYFKLVDHRQGHLRLDRYLVSIFNRDYYRGNSVRAGINKKEEKEEENENRGEREKVNSRGGASQTF